MIGQRVRLASGGPVMLVADLKPEKWEVLCSWPGGEAWFHIIMLDVIRGSAREVKGG